MKFCVFVATEEQKLSNSFTREDDFILKERNNFKGHAALLFEKYHELWETDTLYVRFCYGEKTVAFVSVVDGVYQPIKVSSFIDLHVIENESGSKLALDVMGERYFPKFSEIEEMLQMYRDSSVDLLKKVSEIEGVGKQATKKMDLFAESGEGHLGASEKKTLVKRWHDLLDNSSDAISSAVQHVNQIDDIINSSESIKSLREKLRAAINEAGHDTRCGRPFKEVLLSFLKSLI